MLAFHCNKRAEVRLEFELKESKPAANSCSLFN